MRKKVFKIQGRGRTLPVIVADVVPTVKAALSGEIVGESGKPSEGDKEKPEDKKKKGK